MEKGGWILWAQLGQALVILSLYVLHRKKIIVFNWNKQRNLASDQ